MSRLGLPMHIRGGLQGRKIEDHQRSNRPHVGFSTTTPWSWVDQIPNNGIQGDAF